MNHKKKGNVKRFLCMMLAVAMVLSLLSESAPALAAYAEESAIEESAEESAIKESVGKSAIVETEKVNLTEKLGKGNPTEGTEGENSTEGTEGENPTEGIEGENPTNGTEGENPTEGAEEKNPAEGTEGEIPTEGTEGETPTGGAEGEDPAEKPEEGDPAEGAGEEDPAEKPEEEDPAEGTEEENPTEGNIPEESLCPHHEQHTEDCGYGEDTSCGYVCKICPIQDLIDALPDAEDITEENAAEVEAQLAKIDEAKAELTDEELDALDIERYMAAVEALEALAGMPEAGKAMPLETGSGMDWSTAWQGSGTLADPYHIRNAAELQGLNHLGEKGDISRAYFVLENDIDLSGLEWIPISPLKSKTVEGNSTRYVFYDIYLDGNYNKITNLTIDRSGELPEGEDKNLYYYAGLFGYTTQYISVSNLGIENAIISTSTSNGYAAPLVARTGRNTIKNCYAANVTLSGRWVGALYGHAPHGSDNSFVYNVKKGDERLLNLGGDDYGYSTNCYVLGENGDTAKPNGTTVKTAEQFASGEVCYLLNEKNDSNVFRQDIGEDPYPVPDMARSIVYRSGNEEPYQYSNKGNTYTVTMEEAEGIGIEPAVGYSTTVQEGADFCFILVKPDDYEAKVDSCTVYVNGSPMSQVNGVYTVSKVKEDLKITLTVRKKRVKITISDDAYYRKDENGKQIYDFVGSITSGHYYSTEYGGDITVSLQAKTYYHGWTVENATLTIKKGDGTTEEIRHDENYPGRFTFNSMKESVEVIAVNGVGKKQYAITSQAPEGFLVQWAAGEADDNADMYGDFSFTVTPPDDVSEPYTVLLGETGNIQDIIDKGGNILINPNWNISEHVVAFEGGVGDSDRVDYTTNVLDKTGENSYTIKCVNKNLTIIVASLVFTENLTTEEKQYYANEEPYNGCFPEGLSVTAKIVTPLPSDEKIKYQWYECDDADGTKPAVISGATGDTYWIPMNTSLGNHYYYVEAWLSGNDRLKTRSVIQPVKISLAEGSGTVGMEGWTYGETSKTPVPASATNGTGNVTYAYKAKGADDIDYADTVPANAGTYIVRATFAQTDQYEAVTATAEFTIAPALLTITAGAQEITYGDSIAQGTNQVTAAGLVNGDRLDSIELTASSDQVSAVNKTVTPSTAKVKNGEADVTANYKITYQDGTLTINKSQPVIIFKSGYKPDKEYDGQEISNPKPDGRRPGYHRRSVQGRGFLMVCYPEGRRYIHPDRRHSGHGQH